MTELLEPTTGAPSQHGSASVVDGLTYSHRWGVLHSDPLMHPVDVSDWPVKLTSARQLFLDDYLIASREGVRRVLHQPHKHTANPVMVGETAVEGGRERGPVLAHVLRDRESGSWRVWYRSRIEYESRGRVYRGPNLYAESTDGIEWKRPSLGLYEFEGTKDNNIILPAGDLRGLIHEPQHAVPWKAVWEHNSPARSPDGIEREGYHVYTSPDGIRWTYAHPSIFHGPRRRSTSASDSPFPLPRIGDTGHVRWDPFLSTYVCDTKGTVPRIGADDRHRFRLQMESDDLIHWSRPRVVAFPDSADLDRGTIGFYGLLGTTYESLWIGYLRCHRLDPWKRVDVQLVTSRDGRTWSRACDRQVFLPLGPEGSWDPDYSEINHAGPILVGDELWFYYRGSILAHSRGTGPDAQKGMGLATLRRDGFASLTADSVAGTVTTRPLTVAGRRLFVNAAALSGGQVRVAILTPDGQPVTGFTAAECAPVEGDHTASPVGWSAGELGDAVDAATLPLRLRFHVQRADLYAFWTV